MLSKNYQNEKIKKDDLKKVKTVLEKNSVHFNEFGLIQEKNIFIKDKLNVTIDELIKSNKTWLTDYMNK